MLSPFCLDVFLSEASGPAQYKKNVQKVDPVPKKRIIFQSQNRKVVIFAALVIFSASEIIGFSFPHQLG